MSTEACTLLFLNTVIMLVADHSFSDISSVTLVAFTPHTTLRSSARGVSLSTARSASPQIVLTLEGCRMPGAAYSQANNL